jgi:hypothetical protein
MYLAIHGTSSSNATSIIANGFNVSKHGSFGRGIYLGENGSVGVVFAQKYNSNLGGRDYLMQSMTALLCYVKIGKSDYTDSSKPLSKSFKVECCSRCGREFDVTAERLTRADSLITTNRAGYRELVMYDNNRIYPVYEVTFWPNYEHPLEGFHHAETSWGYYWGNRLERDDWNEKLGDDVVEALKEKKALLSQQFIIAHESGLHGGMKKENGKILVERTYGYPESDKHLPPAPLLHWAIHFQHWPLVEALVLAGADVLQVSEGGVLPHDLLSTKYVLMKGEIFSGEDETVESTRIKFTQAKGTRKSIPKHITRLL